MITNKISYDVDLENTWIKFSVTKKQMSDFFAKYKEGKPYDVEIRQHRMKRSLNANAYCWKLIGEIAEELSNDNASYSNNDIYEALLESVNSNNKKDFKLLIEQFKDLNQDRIETIENKEKYILNNWKERQTYLNNKYMRCSMESHISHILADLFTARPKAYSKKGLNHLLKLRLLKVNGTDIKKLYLNKLINPSEINECNTQTKINVNKIIFPTDTKTNKYLNNFYNTGMDIFDYIQKEEISFI